MNALGTEIDRAFDHAMAAAKYLLQQPAAGAAAQTFNQQHRFADTLIGSYEASLNLRVVIKQAIALESLGAHRAGGQVARAVVVLQARISDCCRDCLTARTAGFMQLPVNDNRPPAGRLDGQAAVVARDTRAV